MAPSFDLSPPATWRRYSSTDVTRVSKKPTHHRHSASARNAKSWTLEDERILLQGRLERLPYKQIGAKLGKSDLACRLHFHQMVMAKRTPQTPAGRSIVFLSSEHPPEVHRLTPANTSSALRYSSMHLLSPSKHPESVSGQSTMHQLSGEFGHRRSTSWSETSTLTPERWLSPTLSCQSFKERRATTSVDLDKLNDIYQEHAEDFWSAIAAKYSGHDQLTPSELELAFLSARTTENRELPSIVLSSADSPKTYHVEEDTYPERMQIDATQGSSDLSIAGKCSVESLLNRTY